MKKKKTADESLVSSMGFDKSLALIRGAVTSAGILASQTEIANYKRIWARDGIVCGLAGLLANDELIVSGLKATLMTLAKAAGPEGQIPSNVRLNETNEIEHVSYGGVCGRVDTISWFIIGACHYIHFTNDAEKSDSLLPKIETGLKLLRCWEFNSRGLIYVPQSGNWADEMIFHGYILYDQLLRCWALNCYRKLFNKAPQSPDIEELKELLMINYWPQPENLKSAQIYHKQAFENYLEINQEPEYFLLSLTPGGYFDQFDALSNALAVLLHIADEKQIKSIINVGQSILNKNPWRMVPCFWPSIKETDAEWSQLLNNYQHQFKCKPCQYQNGGVWPIINGWWGLALIKAGYYDEAKDVLNSIYNFNKIDVNGDRTWTFYEFGHADKKKQGGADKFCWSAAGALILHCYLNGQKLFFG